MKRLLSFFQKNCQTSLRRRLRLDVEALEGRLVPSASSTALHSVTEAGGTVAGGTVAFFRNQFNDTLYEKTAQGLLQPIAPAHSVTDFSAGLDKAGHAILFAHKDGVMQEFTESGWKRLKEPVKIVHFAAAKNDHLYAVSSDHSLVVLPAAQTQSAFAHRRGRLAEIDGTHTMIGVDAITQKNGVDVVFGLDENRNLKEFIPLKNKMLTIAPLPVDSFSVGLDTSGFANVYTIISKDAIVPGAPGAILSRWTPAGFTTVSDIDPLATISATTNAQVFVNSTISAGSFGPSLSTFSPGKGVVAVPNAPPYLAVQQISAAGENDFFVIQADGTFAEHKPNMPADKWIIYT